MKKNRMLRGLAWIAFCAVTALLLQGSLRAETVDVGYCKVDVVKGGCSVALPDRRQIISGIGSQFFKPTATSDLYTHDNFEFPEAPVVKQEKGKLEISGKAAAQGMQEQEGIKTYVEIGMNYKITFNADGKMSLDYEYVNLGDDVFFDPYVNVNINYDVLKKQKWTVKKAQGAIQGGTFPEEIEHGLLSADFSQGAKNLVELQINSATLDTTLGKPIVCNLSPETHLRLHGAGTIVLYNFNHFAAVATSKMAWKVFKKGEKFSIKADVLLPVKITK